MDIGYQIMLVPGSKVMVRILMKSSLGRAILYQTDHSQSAQRLQPTRISSSYLCTHLRDTNRMHFKLLCKFFRLGIIQ